MTPIQRELAAWLILAALIALLVLSSYALDWTDLKGIN